MHAPVALSFAVWKLVGFVVANPVAWIAALLAASILLWVRGRARGAALACAAALLLLTALSSPPVASRLERWLESSAENTYRPGVRYDAVVILASDPARIAAAGKVVRARPAGEVLYSGRPSTLQAEELRVRIAGWGVPEDKILIGRSRNTHENAVESAQFAAARGWRTILVVTSAVHVPRAVASLHAAGLDPDVLPVPASDEPRSPSPWPTRRAMERSVLVLHEVIGLAVYRALGYAS